MLHITAEIILEKVYKINEKQVETVENTSKQPVFKHHPHHCHLKLWYTRFGRDLSCMLVVYSKTQLIHYQMHQRDLL